MSSNYFLQALSEDRSKDAEVLKKPQYAGIMNMVTELYPDNAHFIYELLQNAEDTEATTITFSLTSEKLVAEHNGIRLFTKNDVESITSIGNSTKRDDLTSIGKFGVGFKAVFSYTNTPTVYSGDFSFKIRDLVVPEIIAPLDKPTDTTIFEFPFNNSRKPALLATREVEKGFVGFGDNTLLFLSHIRKINYSLPDGSQGSLERIDHENGRIEIRAKHPHSEETVSHWLHFHKDVEVTDADSNLKNCRVAMAYQLEKITDKNKDSETWKIIPVHGGGQVSIYFPAEKETSKLRFHIHAPFASTVARDSVRDCDDNQQLRDHLAELIVESFTAIRDQEMLIMSFLAVLPTPKDELAEFYEPIRTKIVHAFKYRPLTPTKLGLHFAGCYLYRGSSKISEVISDADLKMLANTHTNPIDNSINDIMATLEILRSEFVTSRKSTSSDVAWVANAPQRNSREDNFLDSLSIKKWDFEQLSEIFTAGNKEKTKSWLETKDDNWLRRFYGLLKDAKQHHEENHYETWAAKNFPLVRVNSEDGVKHVKAGEAYFEPTHSDISANGIQTVKREVYTKDNAKRDIDENAETFLKCIGVRPFDTTAAIGQLLNRYKTPRPDFNSYDHYDDIKQFVYYLKEHTTPYSWNQPTGFAEIKERFKTESFLLCTLDNKSVWRKASDICLDGSIFKTGLAEFTEIHQKLPIWHNYSKKLNKDELKDFIEFLKSFGVMHKLEVVQLSSAEANRNPKNTYLLHQYNGIGKDYSIPKLSNYIECRRTTASKLIWQALINAPFYVKDACFKPNRKPEKTFDALLICELKDKNWIPSSKDNFLRTPRAMIRDDLPDDFPFNNNNGLLTALEFGKNAKNNEEREKRLQEQATASFKQRDIFAKENGFESLDEMEDLAALAKELKAQGKTTAEIRAILNPPKPDFSDDVSSNPTRRAEKVKEAADDAPEKRSTLKLRSVAEDNTGTKKAAKSYLLDRYTDNDKILYCQICKQEMPFKLSDGSYYFETVQLIGDTQKRHQENYIALCPTDAAKFQYANSSKDDIKDMLDLLIDDRSEEEINDNSYDNEEISFEIELAGETKTLTFTPKHLADLKTILFS